jgi:two-component system, sensor histidine kinase and response regulator
MPTNFQFLNSQILVIGDSSEECDRIQSILASAGYRVSVVLCNPDSMDQIQPDLLILSAALPHTDQSALIQHIRQHTALYIPILCITSEEPSKWVCGMGIEANDFIEMPVEPTGLLNRVQILLQWKDFIDELIQGNQQRENFFAYLVHDLRTPLNATNQVLQQILQGIFGSTLLELQAVLNQITESNQALIQMVETLLDSYQYESGERSLHFLPVNLVALSQQVVNALSPLAHQKGLSLALSLVTIQELGSSELVVLGDRLELYRLLVNLIGNAIQHTETGSVEVRLFPPTRGDIPGDEQILIEIEDTGVGISAEELATVFDRFQPGRSRGRGYGLGLYLANQIVKAHQGTLVVRSELGRGSVFTICLPVHADH